MSLNEFDKIIYINLEHRKDRKKELLSELKKLNVDKKKIKRIPAHYYTFNGHIGCVLSHIDALEYALKNEFEKVLILEDDATFIDNVEFINSYIQFFFHTVKDWDVFLLGGKIYKREKTKYPYIYRVTNSICAHAYLINKTYIPTLLKEFKRAFNGLEKIHYFFDKKNNTFALDRAWAKLQKKDRWYMGKIVIASQRNSYSDIELKELNKNVKGLNKYLI